MNPNINRNKRSTWKLAELMLAAAWLAGPPEEVYTFGKQESLALLSKHASG